MKRRGCGEIGRCEGGRGEDGKDEKREEEEEGEEERRRRRRRRRRKLTLTSWSGCLAGMLQFQPSLFSRPMSGSADPCKEKNKGKVPIPSPSSHIPPSHHILARQSVTSPV